MFNSTNLKSGDSNNLGWKIPGEKIWAEKFGAKNLEQKFVAKICREKCWALRKPIGQSSGEPVHIPPTTNLRSMYPWYTVIQLSWAFNSIEINLYTCYIDVHLWLYYISIIPTKGDAYCVCLYKQRGMADFHHHFLGGYRYCSSSKPRLRMDLGTKKGSRLQRMLNFNLVRFLWLFEKCLKWN